MWKLGPFIIKASCLGYTGSDAKPLWQWSGFHHYLFTLAMMALAFVTFILLDQSGSSAAGGAWIATCVHYLIKELRENGKLFEALDFLTPLVFGGITTILFIYIERLVQHATS